MIYVNLLPDITVHPVKIAMTPTPFGHRTSMMVDRSITTLAVELSECALSGLSFPMKYVNTNGMKE